MEAEWLSRRAECALATFRGSSRLEPGLATGEICSAANLTINTACQAGLTNIHGVVQSCPGQPLNIIGGPQEETAVSDCPGDWLRLGRGCYLPVQLEGGVSLPALVLTPAQLPPGTDQDTVQIFAEMYKQVIPYFCTSNLI